MTEERITERTDAAGNVTERVIERGEPTVAVTPVAMAPASSGGGANMFIIVILLLAVVIGGYFLLTQTAENKQDAAVAEAADNVGEAAKKVGDSVEKAVDKLGN